MISGYPQRPLTYSEWLASRGAGNPYAPTPQAPPPQKNPIVDAGMDLAKNYGKKYIKDQIFGSGGDAAASEASNMAWNEGANLASQEAWNQGANLATEQAGSQLGSQAAPSVLGNFSSMGFGPQAAIIAATMLTAKGVKDLIKGKKSDPITRGVTAMSTFGGSEVARALGFGNHKSTKEIQSDKWSDMVKQGKLTQEQADHFYFKGAKNDDSIYDEGPRKGQKWSWEGALEDAKKDPKVFAAVAGNIDTLGQDFWKLSDQQRDTWVKNLIDNNQYYSSKGMIKIKDQDFARQAYQDVLSGKIPAYTNSQTTPQPIMIPKRSSTRSPGVGMDGRPVYNSNRR